jgi:hypothetical protein
MGREANVFAAGSHHAFVGGTMTTGNTTLTVEQENELRWKCCNKPAAKSLSVCPWCNPEFYSRSPSAELGRMGGEKRVTSIPKKLDAKWFENFDAEHEDGEADLGEAVRLLREHAEACKIDEAQLESAAEEIERLRSIAPPPPPPPADVQAVVDGLQRIIDDFTPDEVVGRSHIQQAIALLQRPFSEELRQAMKDGSEAIWFLQRHMRDDPTSPVKIHGSAWDKRADRSRDLLTRAAEGKEK